jgi:autotransporter-associated beta strand protein
VSSLWSDGRNWDGGAPTGDPEPYVAFPDGSSPHPSTINDIVGLRVSKIGLFGDSYTLRGNPITLIVETLIWQAPIHGGNNTIGLNMTFTGGCTFQLDGGTLNMDGVLSGSGIVDAWGHAGSTLVLRNYNAYTGSIFVEQVTLQVAVTNAIPPTSLVSMRNGTLTLDSTVVQQRIGSMSGTGSVNLLGNSDLYTGGDGSSTSYSGIISGSGSLYKEGTGTLTLAGANTFTGITYIANGTLRVGASNVLPNNMRVYVSPGATFDLNNTSLALGSLGGRGNVTLGTGTLTTGNNNQDAGFGGVISGAGGLTKVGQGMMSLTGASTYGGPTQILAGTLDVFDAANRLPSDTSVSVSAGATLQLSSNQRIGSLAGAGNVVTRSGYNVTLTTGSNGNSTTFSGVISGPGSITKEGTGTFTLAAANTYTGATTITAGTLQGTVANALPSGTALALAMGTTLTLNYSDAVLASLEGRGNIYLDGGTLTTGSNNASSTFSGILSGGAAFTKVGTGTLTLSGNNLYTGPTTIAAGTLLIQGTQPRSAVTVNNGAVLGGSGTSGPVTVRGTISPGAGGPAIFTSGTVVFNAGSSYRTRLNGIDTGIGYDQLNAIGSVNLANSPTLNFSLGFASAVGDTFVIVFTTSGIIGTFEGLADNALINNNGATFRINYTASSIVLTHIASPADHFLVSAPATVTSGTPFEVTVTALGSNGIPTNYVGTVHLTTSDAAATLPGDYSFTDDDQGMHTFSVTLGTAGPQSVNVTDTIDSTISGTAITALAFPVPTADSHPAGITAGPDGSLWFTERRANQIGRITPDGLITEFLVPTPNSSPTGITLGRDGKLWFTEQSTNKIGSIMPEGTFSELDIPTTGSMPWEIATGPEILLWFTEAAGNKIAVIFSTVGGIYDFSVPTPNSQPRGIAVTPDNTVWFTEFAANKIGRFEQGRFTEFSLPTPNSGPNALTVGEDGNVWFTEYNGRRIGRITPDGALTEFPVFGANNLVSIAVGPDGNIWFTENNEDRIGRITPEGAITEFAISLPNGLLDGITLGPDGALWFTESEANQIGRLDATILVDQGPSIPLEGKNPSCSVADTVATTAPSRSALPTVDRLLAAATSEQSNSTGSRMLSEGVLTVFSRRHDFSRLDAVLRDELFAVFLQDRNY